MRRNVYDIIKNTKIDLGREYKRLYEQFYKTPIKPYYSSISKAIEFNFKSLDKQLIGRCISLQDFNEHYGFDFENQPNNKDIVFLLTFAEYILTFCKALLHINDFKKNFVIQQLIKNIISFMEDIGYTFIQKEFFVLIIEKSAAVTAAAEITEPNLSYSVLEYNHHLLKGNLSRKKSILKCMADDIEPIRSKLNEINKSFTSDLFQLFNIFIRHDTSDNKKIAEMTDKAIEKVYDDIYQMWIIAKLMFNHIERKQRISSLLKKINE